MTDVHILIAITILGYISVAYLGTGMALKEFSGIDLPFIKQIYESSFIAFQKSQVGKWLMDFRGNRICSVCKTVFTEDEWEQFDGIPDRCPKCGSYNNIV